MDLFKKQQSNCTSTIENPPNSISNQAALMHLAKYYMAKVDGKTMTFYKRPHNFYEHPKIHQESTKIINDFLAGLGVTPSKYNGLFRLEKDDHTKEIIKKFGKITTALDAVTHRCFMASPLDDGLLVLRILLYKHTLTDNFMELGFKQVAYLKDDANRFDDEKKFYLLTAQTDDEDIIKPLVSIIDHNDFIKGRWSRNENDDDYSEQVKTNIIPFPGPSR